jgi:hypothetical protein
MLCEEELNSARLSDDPRMEKITAILDTAQVPSNVVRTLLISHY